MIERDFKSILKSRFGCHNARYKVYSRCFACKEYVAAMC